MASEPQADRAGHFITPAEDYRAFVPKPLPPDPPLDLDPGLLALMEDAGTELGRLDGVARVIPDPDFFVSMYVRREAVLSSQIEGTQSTLEDLLARELHEDDGPRSDVIEIVNYVAAMNHGLGKLEELPVSLRLIREIHKKLLQDGRGSEATPGEFRRTQNWIGPAGASLKRATFVPPPVPEMKQALHDFELFLNTNATHYPTLIEVGLAHAQFETIHPFLDGNGRVGRLLNTFLLVQRGVLRQPLLYLSYYFKLHRTEYYDRLMAVRIDGDWEGWIHFFLRGVIQTAQEATETAEQIFEMRESHRKLIIESNLGPNGLMLLSHLFQRPLVNINLVAGFVGSTFPTASRLVGGFEELGILREITGQRRSRIYRYEPYVRLFDESEHGEATRGMERQEITET